MNIKEIPPVPREKEYELRVTHSELLAIRAALWDGNVDANRVLHQQIREFLEKR